MNEGRALWSQVTPSWAMLYHLFLSWPNLEQNPIVDVISPIVFVCQLFLSNLMYFVILGSISPNLWHNPRVFRAINGDGAAWMSLLAEERRFRIREILS